MSAMARVHVFAVARRVRGPPGRPEDPVRAGLRPSAGSMSFIVCRNLRAAMVCRGNGRGGARTAAWTRKATRDCFWDLAESFLRWKKRGTLGRRSAHGARIGRGNDWKDLSVHSSRWLKKKTVRAHHLVSRNTRRVGRAMTHLVTAARAARAGAAQVKEAMTAC